jgi:hypothetical protein
MKFIITDRARELMSFSMKEGVADPILLIHRGGCTCWGKEFAVEYASKSSVEPFLEGWGFEKVGEEQGLEIFMNDRLKRYLEQIGSPTFIIDADLSGSMKGLSPNLRLRLNVTFSSEFEKGSSQNH